MDIPGITLEKENARKHPRACTLFLKDLKNLLEARASCSISLFADCLMGKIIVPTILEYLCMEVDKYEAYSYIFLIYRGISTVRKSPSLIPGIALNEVMAEARAI